MSRLNKVLTAVLGIDEKEITDAMSPETTKSWDSFHGLLLADELEKEFNLSFTIDEIMDVKNVADIKRHLKTHGVNPDEPAGTPGT